MIRPGTAEADALLLLDVEEGYVAAYPRVRRALARLARKGLVDAVQWPDGAWAWYLTEDGADARRGLDAAEP
jgi:hypothetical protein